MGGLKDLDFEDAVRIIKGDLGFLGRLMDEGKLSKVEGELLRECAGVASGDATSRVRLKELAEKYLGEGGYEQLIRFLDSMSRVSWMVFVRNYEVKVGKDVEGMVEWSLEEHRAKYEVIKVTLVEYVERVRVREENGWVRGGAEGS